MKNIIALLMVGLIFACSTKLSEEEYYTKAKESYSALNFELAITNFKDLVNNYPEGKRHAEGLFMLGFINANDLKDFDEAKKYYEEFIAKYPEHELADDAKYELQTLGKDINDLPIFQNLSADSTSESPSN